MGKSMIYLKARNKETGKVTICARFANDELFEATRWLVTARKKVSHCFLFLTKERAGK
jgi:hypothetical protein